jgi:hypothetical protein
VVVMAATRNASASRSGSDLICPECGKTFSRPAGLGAHRQRVHGVAGSSKNASGRQRRLRSQQAASARNGRRGETTRRRSRGSSADGRVTAVDRDALLRTLFPAGIPPRQDVIAAVNNWLDEAERLVILK